MKILAVGMGHIAEKAYLPILPLIEGIEYKICSRDEKKLLALNSRFKVPFELDYDKALDEKPDAVMIHAATSAHFSLAKKSLNKGIPTYVDKPLSDQIGEVEELFRLAEEKNVLLRTGFNRQRTPSLKKISDIDMDIVFYQKNRASELGEPRTFIFDDYIHVIDSVKYLLKHPIKNIDMSYALEGRYLRYLSTTIKTNCSVGYAVMHREAGITEEVISVYTKGKKIYVDDFYRMHIYDNNREHVERSSSWLSTLDERGFYGLIKEFIEDVKLGGHFMEKDLDSLETHRLCEEIFLRIN